MLSNHIKARADLTIYMFWGLLASPRSNKESDFISALANTVTLFPEGGDIGRKKMRSRKLSTGIVLLTYL